MKILVAGGTGLVGHQLVPALINAGHQVAIVGRKANKIRQQFPSVVAALSWDDLIGLDANGWDAIINLAGENIAACRWNEKVKKALITSRIESTTKLIAWARQATDKKPHLYNASAIGIYGLAKSCPDNQPGLDEHAAATLSTQSNFSSSLVREWEKAAMSAESVGMPVTIMRFGVVLQRGDGMLKKLMLPAQLGLGAIVGDGRQPLSWIDSADLVRAILFLLAHKSITGPVNLVSPEVVTQANFTKTLAKVLGRPTLMRLPAWFVKLAFGQMGEELLLAGQAVSPARLLSLNFSFYYPTLMASLRHQVGADDHS